VQQVVPMTRPSAGTTACVTKRVSFPAPFSNRKVCMTIEFCSEHECSLDAASRKNPTAMAQVTIAHVPGRVCTYTNSGGVGVQAVGPWVGRNPMVHSDHQQNTTMFHGTCE
jgi:hypothetical protein